ncbi:MAG: prepilin-type N-terminal cleavage/methylation domain-containing protein [Firmicutes bacterium]|nr:prepilin-type N-terminal cleavage/methylation domain-containing protein [Bacillota bacterium]
MLLKSPVATLRKRVRQIVKDKKGFTLIEILIVVAIIGILAAIAVPNVTRALQTAKTNADAANIALLETAVNMYYVDKGTWPTAGTGFQTVLVNEGYLKTQVSPPPGLPGSYKLTIDTRRNVATVTRQ